MLTFQRNAHKVFASSENLSNISRRVLGDEIFEKEIFKSTDLIKFFNIVKAEAPHTYE